MKYLESQFHIHVVIMIIIEYFIHHLKSAFVSKLEYGIKEATFDQQKTVSSKVTETLCPHAVLPHDLVERVSWAHMFWMCITYDLHSYVTLVEVPNSLTYTCCLHLY